MNAIAAIQRINEAELQSGAALNLNASWHAKFLKSAWIYIGNLPLELTEGDVLCIISQYGEVEDINLVRDETTGKSRGFGFVKYEDARSCVLAVDNFSGSKILGRSIRVDHVEQYRLPKHLLEKEKEKEQTDNQYYGHTTNEGNNKASILTNAGHAYQNQDIKGKYDIHSGQDLFAKPPPVEIKNNIHSNESDEKVAQNEKEAKRLRKEARAQIRKEREQKRQKREEKRRMKRAKTIKSETVPDDYSNSCHGTTDDDNEDHIDTKQARRHKKKHSKRKRSVERKEKHS